MARGAIIGGAFGVGLTIGMSVLLFMHIRVPVLHEVVFSLAEGISLLTIGVGVNSELEGIAYDAAIGSAINLVLGALVGCCVQALTSRPESGHVVKRHR